MPTNSPPTFVPLYTGLVPYEFFERDPVSGRLREFDEAFGNTAIQRFHERVYDVAYDISQVLKYLGDPAHAATSGPRIPRPSSWPPRPRTSNRSATSCGAS